MYKAGNRQGAKDKLAGIVAKNPEAKGEAEIFRFQWLAKEDPAAWRTEAKKMVQSGKPAERQMVINLAIHEAASPDGDHDIARKAIELALNTAPKLDRMMLIEAIAVYGYVGDYPKANAFIDKLLATVPDDAVNAELRKSMIAKKAGFEQKMKQQK